MSGECVIVDANIAFRSLLAGRGDLRERIGLGGHPRLFTPRFLLVELFKHKERLQRASGLPETDLLFMHEDDISVGTWMEAYRLCKGIDVNDTQYVALTLHLEGCFWTEDNELKTALRTRNFDRFFEP